MNEKVKNAFLKELVIINSEKCREWKVYGIHHKKVMGKKGEMDGFCLFVVS